MIILIYLKSGWVELVIAYSEMPHFNAKENWDDAVGSASGNGFLTIDIFWTPHWKSLMKATASI